MASVRMWILMALVACTLLAKTSEVNAQRGISYGAIGKGDAIPCSKRGGSQTNCNNPKDGNPYERGCNPGEQCRDEKHN